MMIIIILYRDDIELLAKGNSNLKEQVLHVECFSRYIGLAKSNTLHLKHGKAVEGGSVELQGRRVIGHVLEDQAYTYLGKQVRDKVQNAHIKDQLRAEY